MNRAYYNENDPFAAALLRILIAKGHITPGEVDERSIVDVRPADLDGFTRVHFFAGIGGWDLALQLAGWPANRPVWTGSCPCQPFSAAGKRGGFDDERHLWPEFFRLIAECRPTAVFGEQVASRDGLDWLDLVSSDLEGADYAFGATDLCAAGVGAPHIRQRLWWVGMADADCDPCGQGSALNGRWDQESDAQSRTRSGCGGLPFTMADSLSPRLEGRNARALGNECEAAERGGAAIGVGDACGAGTRGNAGTASRAESGGSGAWSADGFYGRHHPDASSNDGWSDFEWLPCRDGKARPTQPGIFPLAHGIPNRVGLLRGAGNAIVPQAGAAFIQAVAGPDIHAIMAAARLAEPSFAEAAE